VHGGDPNQGRVGEPQSGPRSEGTRGGTTAKEQLHRVCSCWQTRFLVLAVVECGRPFGAGPVAGAGPQPTRIMRFREAAAALRHIFWTCKVAGECKARSCVG
jgi:hypothetical protein